MNERKLINQYGQPPFYESWKEYRELKRMKPRERDELLIRLDERVDKILQHAELQNGWIENLSLKVEQHIAESCNKLAWIKPITWVIGIILLILIAVVVNEVGVWQIGG